MTERINEYVSVTIEVTKGTGILGMNQGYATLYDHNRNRIIRTIRGQYILEDETEKEFLATALEKFAQIVSRYTILASVYEFADDLVRTDIDKWLEEDSHFNDAKWHGDDRKQNIKIPRE